MSKLRIAIFGGSFDPIHIGHLSLAAEVCRRGMADEVWFMVSPQNPHKQSIALTDENIRYRMVQLAIEGVAGFKASDFEFSLPRPSYTIKTLDALEKAYPNHEFRLLIGSDNWEKFDRWYNGDEILSRFGVIVYPRGEETAPPLPSGVEWLPAELYNVSSTMIRGMVAAGEDISALVPNSVAACIETEKLYR